MNHLWDGEVKCKYCYSITNITEKDLHAERVRKKSSILQCLCFPCYNDGYRCFWTCNKCFKENNYDSIPSIVYERLIRKQNDNCSTLCCLCITCKTLGI